MFIKKSDLKEAIKELVDKERSGYHKTEMELRAAIETLKIEKGRIEEERAKQLREVEHKVGLERLRQRVEKEQAVNDATLKLREEALKLDKTRFEEQMKFERGHTEKQIAALNVLVGQLLDRLPSASILAKIGGDRGGDK